MLKITCFFTLILLLTLFSCQDNEVEKGKLNLSFSESFTATNDGRVQALEPASVIISIDDSQGNEVLIEKKFLLSKMGESYLVDPILLEIGEYHVTKFLVLNGTDEVIYATPVAGSTLQSLVNDPLPVSITISSDIVTELQLEVIETSSVDPEDLGYSSIAFSIVPVVDILVSVFDANQSTNYSFANSDLTIFADGDSVRTIELGDSINVVRIRTDIQEVSLKFDLAGFSNQTVNLPVDSLYYYKTTPLEIIFNEGVNLSNGLLAYYSFDGNANDLSGNNLHGTVNGATLIEDRSGSANSAYYFDGTDDYIDLNTGPIFDLGNYSEFTVSAWINPEVATSGIIVGKYISASDNRMWVLQIVDNEVAFSVYDNGGTITIDRVSIEYLNEWQNVTAVFESNTYKLYQNGTLVDSATKSATMISESPTAKTVIGAAHQSGHGTLFDVNYHGASDEIRIYNRAISTDEIQAIYNQ